MKLNRGSISDVKHCQIMIKQELDIDH